MAAAGCQKFFLQIYGTFVRLERVGQQKRTDRPFVAAVETGLVETRTVETLRVKTLLADLLTTTMTRRRERQADSPDLFRVRFAIKAQVCVRRT